MRYAATATCIVTILLAVTTMVTAETYEYDDAGRLVKVTWDDQRSITYQYDAAGNIVSIITQGVSGIEDQSGGDESRSVLNISTTSGTSPVRMEIRLPEGGGIELAIVDSRGSEVTVITEGTAPKGRTLVEWSPSGADGDRLPSGAYFARLRLHDRSGVDHEWVCRFVLLH